MNFKKLASTAAVAGALAAAAIGAGSGTANADPKWPSPPPWPIPGPGVNLGAPGHPLPPGHGGLPPPGHRADFAVVPVWAPPAPPPPVWAPWLPVSWNAELNAWGVWWNGGFQTL